MSTKSKSRKPRGASKGTTLKYSKVVKTLRGIDKPTKINSTEYAKEHNVSTNLILALINMGYLTKQEDGYVWNSSMKGSDMEIAEKARVMANQWTNKKKPTRQRPTGKRTYKGRKKSTVKKSVKKTVKSAEPQAKRTYTKRNTVHTQARQKRQTATPSEESYKMQLAKEFTKRKMYKDALELLQND